MNTEKEHKRIDAILKDANSGIEPHDSWEKLRARIDTQLEQSLKNKIQNSGTPSLRFWRRLSLAMAACFVMTAGILIYVLGINHGANIRQQQVQYAHDDMIPGENDVDTLLDTFAQVRKLFGEQSRWIAIGSDNNSDVGLSENTPTTTKSEKLVIVRLAISYNNDESHPRYYDIITYEDQLANLNLPLTSTHSMEVALKPVIQNDGTISVEIDANINGASKSESICTIANDRFTQLVHMRINGDWVRIDGVGKFVSITG